MGDELPQHGDLPAAGEEIHRPRLGGGGLYGAVPAEELHRHSVAEALPFRAAAAAPEAGHGAVGEEEAHREPVRLRQLPVGDRHGRHGEEQARLPEAPEIGAERFFQQGPSGASRGGLHGLHRHGLAGVLRQIAEDLEEETRAERGIIAELVEERR